MPAAPVVTYNQIHDPSVSLPGLPGVVDVVMRTLQALSIYAINTPPIVTFYPPISNPPVDTNLGSLLRAWASITQGL